MSPSKCHPIMSRKSRNCISRFTTGSRPSWRRSFFQSKRVVATALRAVPGRTLSWAIADTAHRAVATTAWRAALDHSFVPAVDRNLRAGCFRENRAAQFGGQLTDVAAANFGLQHVVPLVLLDGHSITAGASLP